MGKDALGCVMGLWLGKQYGQSLPLETTLMG